MKVIPSILVLMLTLLLASASVVGAITVTATPNPALVGQSTQLTVNANVTSASCPITVAFGEGPTTTLTCTTTGPCVGVFTHTYSAAGIYSVGASGPVASSCTLGANTTWPLTVNCPSLNIVTASMPGGIVGQPYSAQLVSSGGVAAIDWEVADTYFLPDGLVISSTGLVSGTPSTYGLSSVSLGVGDSCLPFSQYTTKPFSINIASPATAELTITRLQLSFDNGRAETTISRNQPGLHAKADVRFDGSGLLEGYWEVDGRMLSRVNQHLTYGESIRLTTPEVPFLPTFVEGSHRVRLVITNPANNIQFPEAIYYVTSEDSTAGLAPIRVAAPRNHAELSFAAQSFSWEGNGTASVYLIELFEREGEEPVVAAYTNEFSYDLPESILNDRFHSGKAYSWWVKSYDAEGNLVGVSKLSDFIFQ